ncbi:hypothetical protein N9L47_10360 [Rhodobacteraceae bacterium]|nr:hypothetical protein [Paracoccaceae bacterium]
MSVKRDAKKDKTPPVRKDRLKAALKANLQRRKAQARARQDQKDEGQ